jgi:AcrR family transcriptional regulator
MAVKRSKRAARKPRADAQRNRERILEVAKHAFTRFGANASLDDIATQARVGPGTLYRHFPTRQALLEAVYQSGVEKLAADAKKFEAELSPLEALRAWLLLFVDYLAAKKIIVPALDAVAGGHSKTVESSYAQIWDSVRALARRAIENGDLRKDLDAIDLLRSILGVAYMASGPDWQENARRLVDILLIGARPMK